MNPDTLPCLSPSHVKADFHKFNRDLTVVKKFKRWLVHQQFASLRQCFDDFSFAGGAFINVNGVPVHFARATIIALYGDHPACVKSTLTGSSCPTCFQNAGQFANVSSVAEPRTEETMRQKKEFILNRIRARAAPGDIGLARKDARLQGINLDCDNGWISPPGVPSAMGPDPDKDNVWANSPSVALHSWDEGAVEKACAATVRHAVVDGHARHKLAATEVKRRIDQGFSRTYFAQPLNSNVEVNGRDAFQLFPHGVCGYLLDKRRSNGKWYSPLADQL